MKWSLHLGRWLGIDVFVHVTFLLLLGVLAVVHWLAHGSLTAVLTGTGFFLALFACVLLHEYGHALAARHFGIATRDITLLPIGGVARLERVPETPSQELWVALAGPLVNVGIAVVLALWLTLTGTWEPLSELSATSGSFAERLLAVNLGLVLFNLLPAFPMDGGRVLRALLAMRMEHSRATRIAARIGQGAAIVFGLAGLFSNPMLLVIAVFVWMGAGQEAAVAEVRSAIGTLAVRDGMITDFHVLSVNDTLGHAARLLLNGSQTDFPVVDPQGRVVGLLQRADLFAQLAERGDDASVGDVMQRSFAKLHPDESLDAALSRDALGASPICVVAESRLVGLLTAENLAELMNIRAALQARPAMAPF